MAKWQRRKRQGVPPRWTAESRRLRRRVVRAKERYENAVKALEALMERREEIRRRELMEAVRKSDHTYEEILCFIRG